MLPKPTIATNADYATRTGAAIDAINRRLKGNLIANGAFQVWQRGTTFAAGAIQYTADRFQFLRTGAVAGATLSRQAGQVAQYAMRIQRDNANASVADIIAYCTLETADCIPLVGLPVCIKMRARSGANYSAAGSTFRVRLFTGTGTDENINTGFTGQATLIDTSPAVAAGQALIGDDGSIKATIGAGVKQLAIGISFTPVGAAGANDWIELEELQMVVGDYPGEFPYRMLAEELAILQRFYDKSFLMDTAPVQNAGANTGEATWAASQAGATAQRSPQIRFDVEMRRTPTVVLYNPSAANAQVRDEGVGDCTASATANLNRKGFNVTATGNAGTAIANMLGIHWAAEAEIV